MNRGEGFSGRGDEAHRHVAVFEPYHVRHRLKLDHRSRVLPVPSYCRTIPWRMVADRPLIRRRVCANAPTGEGEMSAREAKVSRRLLLAGGSAFGLGLLSAPASSQAPEKITYLFPAPPILPAFGPIRLA